MTTREFGLTTPPESVANVISRREARSPSRIDRPDPELADHPEQHEHPQRTRPGDPARSRGGRSRALPGPRAGPVPRRPLLLRPVRRPPPGSRGTDRRHDAQARRRARRRRPHPGRQALSVPGT